MNEREQFLINHKLKVRKLLTETAHSLLLDLKAERRFAILEEQTIEELMDFICSIYNREFDVNVPSLGVVGAGEIAWQEAMGIFEERDSE